MRGNKIILDISILLDQLKYGFKCLGGRYIDNKYTKGLAHKFNSISDDQLIVLMEADFNDYLSENKEWCIKTHQNEDQLLKMFPEINILCKDNDGYKFNPYLLDISIVLEKFYYQHFNNFVPFLSIIGGWDLWGIKIRYNKKSCDIYIENTGDYRILEWERMVNEGVITFSRQGSTNEEYLSSEYTAINSECCRLSNK